LATCIRTDEVWGPTFQYFCPIIEGFYQLKHSVGYKKMSLELQLYRASRSPLEFSITSVRVKIAARGGDIFEEIRNKSRYARSRYMPGHPSRCAER